eukprot:TRINITY_DN17051_c0_g1_i4.p1 TRINITY_DN17051_c0_g1~~TRINITY_DN17051_c0_g1_i4.p1  ORF type:complete len:2008 (+),score=805.96 TRINITY_DN17051_c0_g1_i4:95-6118(+)
MAWKSQAGKTAGKGKLPQGSAGMFAGKRPFSPAAAAPSQAPKAARVDDDSIIVFSASGRDDERMMTLIGEYSVYGENHSRKTYVRTSTGEPEELDVYLYYWDERDGKQLSGWWFGAEVGGAEVWSRKATNSMVPPKSGWMIPWDGDVEPDLVVMTGREKNMREEREAQIRKQQRLKEEAAKTDNRAAKDWEGKVLKMTEKVAELEIDLEETIETVNSAIERVDSEAVAAVQETLKEQAKTFAEQLRGISQTLVAGKAAPPTLKAELTKLQQRVREHVGTIKKMMDGMKDQVLMPVKEAPEEEEEPEDKLAEDDEDENRVPDILESQHQRQLEEMLPIAMEKVDHAEDEVEKAAIAAAPLNIDASEDLRSVMLEAIKETERLVRLSQAKISEARRFVQSKLTLVQGFAITVKRAAIEEMQLFKDRLQEAENKLKPLKTVRQEYEGKVQARKLSEELSAKIAVAEIEVEKVVMMAAPLSGDFTEGIKETELSVNQAQSALSQVSRMIESKTRLQERNSSRFGEASKAMLDELKDLQDRCKQSQEKLDDVKKTLKETQTKVAADSLLRDVSSKVSAAEEELQRVSEVELSFLKGDEDNIGKQLDEGEELATSVHTALTNAHTFVAKKLVEVARFGEGSAKAIREEITGLQKRLEDGRGRLKTFRLSIAEKKRGFLLQEVDVKVKQAEGEVQTMREAIESLPSAGGIGEGISEAFLEAVEKANLAERSVQSAITVARKQLLKKTDELKNLPVVGAGAGAELGKLQTRVNNLSQEMLKFREATKDAEERIRVKQLLSEVLLRLQAAEAEVDKVAASAASTAASKEDEEAEVDRLEKATAAAQAKIAATAKLVDVKLKSATGFLKAELTAMKGRTTEAETKLSKVAAASKEQKERRQGSDLAAESTAKVNAATALLEQVTLAEQPFQQGLDAMDPKEAVNAVAECERLATAAQKAISEGRTYLVQKLAAAKDFATMAASESLTKDLQALQKKLDAAASKLAVSKKENAERKRKTMLVAASEKVSGLEKACKTLATEMERLSEEQLAKLATEDAQKAFEEVAQAEKAAVRHVNESKKFLATRQQEVKSLPEAQRAPLLSELSKLQARLTQCQVEMSKLSRQLTDKEQAFVARRIWQDLEVTLGKLQRDHKACLKSANAVLKEEASALADAYCFQLFLEALQAYVSASSATVEDVFAAMVGGPGKTCSLESFTTYLDKLPEISGSAEAIFTAAQSSAIYKLLAGNKQNFALDALKKSLRQRLACEFPTVATKEADSSEVLFTVEAGEVVEVLEEQQDAAGNMKTKCVLVRDKSTVWVTLQEAGSDEANFRPTQQGAARLDSVEACVSGIFKGLGDLSEEVEGKLKEVQSVKQGPLSEAKEKLVGLRGKVSQERSASELLRDKLAALKETALAKRQEEVAGALEARCKNMAETSVAEALKTVEAGEKKASKAVESCKAAVVAKPGAEAALSVGELDGLIRAADEASQALAASVEAIGKMQERFEAQGESCRPFLADAKAKLSQYVRRAQASEKRCGTASEKVRQALSKAVQGATKKARAALQSAARKSGKTVDQLFDQVAAGRPTIDEKKFVQHVKSLPNHGLIDDEISLALKDLGHFGRCRAGFLKAFQEFQKVTSSVSLTDKLEMQSASTLRKLGESELFEVLEGPVQEPETQVMRVRGRALKDGSAGWATITGNQGKEFLASAEKPFVIVSAAADLHTESRAAAPLVRRLQRDEVLELLEGPRTETPPPELVLRGSSSSSGSKASGFITLRDSAGKVAAELSKEVYICKSSIAMTDVFDIKNCKVVRKILTGEVLQVVGGGQKEDSAVEITRLRFKALKDGKEGWVTLKGNQGTRYVEASTTHYVLGADSATLREGPAGSASEVCQLPGGSVFEAAEAPQERPAATRLVARVRAFEDCKAGWVVFATNAVSIRPWRPKYACLVPVPLTAELSSDSAVVREAVPDEVFEVAEGPTLDAKSGVRRIRCVAANGSLVGWASLRDAASGKPMLQTKL